MDTLVARAREFATEAHVRIDQRRKYTQQPYQEHLKAVAQLVMEVSDDPETIAAAWLHDTVEDTTATFGDLEQAFGPAVAQLVAELTDASKPSDGNRATRKAIDLRHSAAASARAQTVKLADLTDNCRDICRHDPTFGRVYLAEAAALLGVLTAGDQVLYRRAQKTVAECAKRLGLPSPSETREPDAVPDPPTPASLSQRRAQRLFTAAFTARDIAEPLRTFDLAHPAPAIAAVLKPRDLEIAGLRGEGVTVGYVRAHDLGAGPADEHLRPFAAGQVITGDASLSEVIGILSRYDSCFVTAMGDVSGVVTRDDIQKPIVRMWLFGIITLVEMDLVERIRTRWPDGHWTRLLSAGRLDKAQALLLERRRRGQHADLLDCIQLGDKARILLEDEGQRDLFGFATKGAAQRVLKDLESLRNNLAHAQDIVTHDWPQIARLARRIEDTIAHFT
ncbi:HD domain-containing protein [uncultured Thiodictyon sp.]|uniref:HD domain-containing protein n=1 Tax=uncultured Thiodictyon sp. TaxID=1846217 RepID=UPI0025FD3E43|nr:HD domain-containing protein [uncultured Thiodictyon sp.]